MASHPLDIAELQTAFRDKTQQSSQVLSNVYDRIEARPDDATWISVVPREQALAAAARLEPSPALPLGGVPFAIKDNIDLAGVPTTAACKEFAYTPLVSAHVVQRLVSAGAIPVGKTNLDQFATGLVGVRSPYGIPKNALNPDYIPGGSSSGSAVAVAEGLCSFSLGTDTAGSGRIPAAFNGLVGLKPTKGLLSTRGVVPACRSLDCVSIFARTCADAAAVLAVAAGYDADDSFSRPATPPAGAAAWPPRIGIPRPEQLEFFGDTESAALFAKAVSAWQRLGATIVEIDFDPFREAARLLYQGGWVAERYAAIRPFIEKQPEALHPVTRQIIEGARKLSAADAFDSIYRLAALRRRSEAVWAQIDFLVTPTAGTAYRVAEVVANPLQLNTNLGYYTNYVNLLDLCALAVPAGVLSSRVGFGITLLAPAFHDDHLLAWGSRFLGEATPPPALSSRNLSEPMTRVAVCGAHLSGLPLNKQLLERNARLVRATQTAAEYRLFALPNTTPPKPGLVRVKDGGSPIEVEVWELPVAHYGSFVAGIPEPLGIGRIRLADGEVVQGFLCESVAVENARDVTVFGGWRRYLAER